MSDLVSRSAIGIWSLPSLGGGDLGAGGGERLCSQFAITAADDDVLHGAEMARGHEQVPACLCSTTRAEIADHAQLHQNTPQFAISSGSLTYYRDVEFASSSPRYV